MQTAEKRDPEILRAFRFRLQQFLQLNYGRPFNTRYLSAYLNIPLEDVERIAAAFVLEGIARYPESADHIEGIAVDWKAVHEGRAPRPAWAVNR